MRLRAGVVRALIAVLALVVLVLPVGATGDERTEIYSIPRAVAELAQGNVQVSLLGAAVAGGSLLGAAGVRLAIVVALWIAYVVAGMAVAQRPVRKAGERRRRCTRCGFVTAASMAHCPKCASPMV